MCYYLNIQFQGQRIKRIVKVLVYLWFYSPSNFSSSPSNFFFSSSLSSSVTHKIVNGSGISAVRTAFWIYTVAKKK